MMQKFPGYDEAKVYVRYKKLPAGAYKVKIEHAEEVKFDGDGKGKALKVYFDILEGAFSAYFRDQYNQQPEGQKDWKGYLFLYCPKDGTEGTEPHARTVSAFKTNMNAIEQSNGFTFNWDENTLKDKLVCAVFAEKEWKWNGKTGIATKCHSFRTLAELEAGDIVIPPTKLLDKSPAAMLQDATPLDENEDETLPF